MSTSNLDTRGMSKEMLELNTDVRSDENWFAKVCEMCNVIEEVAPELARELRRFDITSDTVRSIVRFCIPLFELQNAYEGVPPDPRSMAMMYLWQATWRPLDDMIDGDGLFSDNLLDFSRAMLTAWQFGDTVLAKRLSVDQFLACLADTLQIEERGEERANPSLIFKRVRLYEVGFGTCVDVSELTRASYRKYLNAIGVAHDFGDIANDIKNQVMTSVTEELRSIDSHCRLTARNYNKLKTRIEDVFWIEAGSIESNILDNCWVTRRNIENFSSWAFENSSSLAHKAATNNAPGQGVV